MPRFNTLQEYWLICKYKEEHWLPDLSLMIEDANNGIMCLEKDIFRFSKLQFLNMPMYSYGIGLFLLHDLKTFHNMDTQKLEVIKQDPFRFAINTKPEVLMDYVTDQLNYVGDSLPDDPFYRSFLKEIYIKDSLACNSL